eukprot:Rmarinus@m.9677
MAFFSLTSLGPQNSLSFYQRCLANDSVHDELFKEEFDALATDGMLPKNEIRTVFQKVYQLPPKETEVFERYVHMRANGDFISWDTFQECLHTIRATAQPASKEFSSASELREKNAYAHTVQGGSKRQVHDPAARVSELWMA